LLERLAIGAQGQAAGDQDFLDPFRDPLAVGLGEVDAGGRHGRHRCAGLGIHRLLLMRNDGRAACGTRPLMIIRFYRGRARRGNRKAAPKSGNQTVDRSTWVLARSTPVTNVRFAASLDSSRIAWTRLSNAARDAESVPTRSLWNANPVTETASSRPS